MGNAKFRLTNGGVSLLCSNCSKIIKTGKDFTEKEWNAFSNNGDIDSYYCDECKDVIIDIDKVENSDLAINSDVMNDFVKKIQENVDFKELLVREMTQGFMDKLKINKK